VKLRSQGWRRHLDGWQAGALVLLLAGSAIVLAAPRAVAPEELPAPTIDRRALAAVLARDERLARAAEETPLDVDVRALGREIRAYNLAAAAGHRQELAEARARVARAVTVALRHDAEPLLALRAYQSLRFVEEVQRWQRDGQASDELRALGGDFVDMLEQSRWCVANRRELVIDDGLLRVLFKTRWNDITSLHEAPFALELDEDRARYGLLLRHPFVREGNVLGGRLEQALAQARRNEASLRIIDRLAQRDPSYPADLARGVSAYRMGRFGLAVEHFRRHLERQPDGPHTLRVQNYLKAALDRRAEGL
jgi:tetratricopeptide (TPR) repeat protein